MWLICLAMSGYKYDLFCLASTQNTRKHVILHWSRDINKIRLHLYTSDVFTCFSGPLFLWPLINSCHWCNHCVMEAWRSGGFHYLETASCYCRWICESSIHNILFFFIEYSITYTYSKERFTVCTSTEYHRAIFHWTFLHVQCLLMLLESGTCQTPLNSAMQTVIHSIAQTTCIYLKSHLTTPRTSRSQTSGAPRSIWKLNQI